MSVSSVGDSFIFYKRRFVSTNVEDKFNIVKNMSR